MSDHVDSFLYQLNQYMGAYNRIIGGIQKMAEYNFKKGDKVKIVHRQAGNTTGMVDYGLLNGDVGKIGVVTGWHYSPTRGSIVYVVEDLKTNEYLGMFSATEIELYKERTVENLQKGDKLKDSYGSVYIFQGYVGDALIVLDDGGRDGVVFGPEERDFTVVNEELTEVTLEEVAKKFGVPVEDIRIKD